MSDFVSVYMTASTDEEAGLIAEALIEARLVACVNILGPIASVYRWEGKVMQDDEVVLIAKTRAALMPELKDRVKAIHSYDVPCIVAWPITDGDEDYLAWVARETKSVPNG